MILFQKHKKELKSTKNHIKSNFGFLVLFLGLVLFVLGCANIKQPMGGPKDVTPPKILKIEPANLSTNFSSNKITIFFDEFFKIQNESKEFTFSPEQEIPPVLSVNKKKLEIKFEDKFKPNTTYTLNFGKSIVDLNEGNVVKNFTYVFSTGKKIDSLSIEGTVKNAITTQPELDLLVFVFPVELDTLFGKKRPTIYSRTDSIGRFSLKNLKEGKYKIYALKDKNGDKIYQEGQEEIGFLKDTISLKKSVKNININIFNENPKAFRLLDRKINTDGSLLFTFNKKLKNPEVKIIFPEKINVQKQFSLEKDSLFLWLNKIDFDSIKVDLFDENKRLQTTTLNRGKKDTYTRNIIPKDNINNGQLSPFEPLKLFFQSPIANIKYENIKLLEDSMAKTNFKIIKDTTSLLTYTFDFPWLQDKKYQIKFDKGAFEDDFKTQSKSTDKKFTLTRKDNYGSFEAKIMVSKNTEKQYIMEFLNDKKKVLKKHSFSKDTIININNIEEGRYSIRVIYDENKNGMWDTGNVYLGIQPEHIWYNPKECSVRGNWERKESFLIPEQ